MDAILIPQQLLINSHFQFTNPCTEEESETIPAIPPFSITNTNMADTEIGINYNNYYIRILKKIKTIKPFVIVNFLPLGFSIALIIALLYPFPGQFIASYNIYEVNIVQAVNSFNVFLVSGITLNIKDSIHAINKWGVLLFGLIVILFITPVLAFGIIKLPLQPPEFAVGLAIFCVVPTTLGIYVLFLLYFCLLYFCFIFLLFNTQISSITLSV